MESSESRKYTLIARSVDDIAIGPKRLTKYERARIVAARALQLALGAPPLIDIGEVKTTDPVIIAIKELERGLPPILIRRQKPNGEYQLIPLRILVEAERSLHERRRRVLREVFRSLAEEAA